VCPPTFVLGVGPRQQGLRLPAQRVLRLAQLGLAANAGQVKHAVSRGPRLELGEFVVVFVIVTTCDGSGAAAVV